MTKKNSLCSRVKAVTEKQGHKLASENVTHFQMGPHFGAIPLFERESPKAQGGKGIEVVTVGNGAYPAGKSTDYGEHVEEPGQPRDEEVGQFTTFQTSLVENLPEMFALVYSILVLVFS